MTVGELIELLAAEEPEREVMISIEIDNEVYDAPVLSVSMLAGVIMIDGCE